MNETDKKILSIIQRDGRIANYRLAAAVGISPPATLARVRRLEDSGIITHYVTLLNRKKIGLGIMAIVFLSLDLTMLASIEKLRTKLLGLDEVLECFHVSGEESFILKVALDSIHSYHDFTVSKLATIPGILSYKSTFILSTSKSETSYRI